MATLSLKKLLVPSKAATVDFPGYDGFKVEVAFLSREATLAIRKKATKTSWVNHVPAETVDDDVFLKMYTEAAVKGWSGLKLAYLETLAPVDLTGQNPEDTLEYDAENALFLMKNSVHFDSFISRTVTELTAFTKPN